MICRRWYTIKYEKSVKEDVGSGTDEVVVQGVLKERDYQFQREGGEKNIRSCAA